MFKSGLESVVSDAEAAELISAGACILDVRTRLETRKGTVPGAKAISLFGLKRHLDELPRDRTILTYCATGGRAGKAKQILEAAGFKAANGGGYARILKISEGLIAPL